METYKECVEETRSVTLWTPLNLIKVCISCVLCCTRLWIYHQKIARCYKDCGRILLTYKIARLRT